MFLILGKSNLSWYSIKFGVFGNSFNEITWFFLSNHKPFLIECFTAPTHFILTPSETEIDRNSCVSSPHNTTCQNLSLFLSLSYLLLINTQAFSSEIKRNILVGIESYGEKSLSNWLLYLLLMYLTWWFHVKINIVLILLHLHTISL